MNEKKKKIIILASFGITIIVLLGLIILCLATSLNKPSKNTAEKLIKNYIKAMNEDDGARALSVIDAEGYLIYQEEGEKKFDKIYKNKSKYMKEYYEDNDLDGIDDIKDDIADEFEDTYKYTSYQCTLDKITSIEKSEKSKKIVIIRAKVKCKTTYTSTTDTYKFYVVKVNGKYRIVNVEE